MTAAKNKVEKNTGGRGTASLEVSATMKMSNIPYTGKMRSGFHRDAMLLRSRYANGSGHKWLIANFGRNRVSLINTEAITSY
ncbi:MAG: hypothetical protein AB4352_29090 [Hormoscilla sp.]